MIEHLQDQAQITLAQYTQIHHPMQPTRYLIFVFLIQKSNHFPLLSFGRLLLTLPLLRSIPSIFIEKKYFSRTIGTISMSTLLAEMFKN
jgi:hypothetical protein